MSPRSAPPAATVKAGSVPSYLKELTEPQRQAIDIRDHNLQIIACAGSGKTRVVAARIVEILRMGAAFGTTPENIVAFTFTEKAAAELKDRITRYYREAFGHVEGLAG